MKILLFCCFLLLPWALLAAPDVVTNAAPAMQQSTPTTQQNPSVIPPQSNANQASVVPMPQTSTPELAENAQVKQLQNDLADLRSLIMIQGRQINALMLQQKQLSDDFNHKLSTLQASANAPQSLSVIQPKPVTSQADQQDIASYQAAYQLMRDRQYGQAITAFNGYLEKYPQGVSVADAHYWLGELYAVAGKNDQAIEQLSLTVNNYPKSDNVAQAMLKLGSMANDQQQYDQAKLWWQKLVSQYPNSTAARVAKTLLQQLNQSGQ